MLPKALYGSFNGLALKYGIATDESGPRLWLTTFVLRVTLRTHSYQSPGATAWKQTMDREMLDGTRQRRVSNPCGQSPKDFESIS